MTTIRTFPGVRLWLDDQLCGDAINRCLASIDVHQNINQPNQCELLLVTSDASRMQPFPTVGQHIRIEVADATGALFSGTITADEQRYSAGGELECRIRAYDDLFKLRKQQHVRSFDNTTIFDVITSVAREHGMEVQGGNTGVISNQLVQWQQSDLEFINELAAQSARYLILRDNTIKLIDDQGENGGEPVKLMLGANLHFVQSARNIDSACSQVDTSAWDPSRATYTEGQEVSAVADVMRDTSLNTLDAERVQVNQIARSTEQASVLARAEITRRRAAVSSVSGDVDGSADLYPGKIVTIIGVEALLNEQYMLTSCFHHLSRQQGYTVSFSTSPPPSVETKKTSSIALGVVVDVDDPDELGRIRVELPAIGAIETSWMQVVLPGAGVGKGIVAIPDVDDHVLVLFVDGDPVNGVVLGGVYGEHSPRHGVESGRVRSITVHSKSGHELTLSDERNEICLRCSDGHELKMTPGRIRLANDEGSCLEMTHNRVALSSKRDLTIEAPGRSLTFRAAAVEFERG